MFQKGLLECALYFLETLISGHNLKLQLLLFLFIAQGEL